jgi:hypothetical protein
MAAMCVAWSSSAQKLKLAVSRKKGHRLVFALDRYIGRHSAHNNNNNNNNNKHLKSRTRSHKREE